MKRSETKVNRSSFLIVKLICSTAQCRHLAAALQQCSFWQITSSCRRFTFSILESFHFENSHSCHGFPNFPCTRLTHTNTRNASLIFTRTRVSSHVSNKSTVSFHSHIRRRQRAQQSTKNTIDTRQICNTSSAFGILHHCGTNSTSFSTL